MVGHLTEADAALIKGMLARGDKQSDIAAWFQCNSGRVAETNKGIRFANVVAAPPEMLPPQGPYRMIAELNGDAASPLSGQVTSQEVRAVLSAFEERVVKELSAVDNERRQLLKELTIATHERRQTNEQITALGRQLADLRRALNLLDSKPPKPTRRRPNAG